MPPTSLGSFAYMLCLVVIFAASTQSQAETDIEIVHSFPFADSSVSLPSSLTYYDSALYGVSYRGGDFGGGTLYSIKPDGTEYKLLHSFSDGSSLGINQVSKVLPIGSRLYGTTSGEIGSSNIPGIAYSINLDGSDFQVVHAFSDATGMKPMAGLIEVGSTLYGTTSRGGSNGGGTVFSMNLDGSNYQVLHEFVAYDVDPFMPYSELTASGNRLYGTTYFGGETADGAIFSMNLDGSDFQSLHVFSGADGSSPTTQLLLAGSTLYGGTYGGGITDNGTIFSINLDGSDFKTIHEFSVSTSAQLSDGAHPNNGLVLIDSTLYGTNYGLTPRILPSTVPGVIFPGLNSTIFSLKLDGSDFEVLHQFYPYSRNEGSMLAGLTPVGSTLYGTNMFIEGSPVVFKITVPEPPAILLLSAFGGVSFLLAFVKRRATVSTCGQLRAA